MTIQRNLIPRNTSLLARLLAFLAGVAPSQPPRKHSFHEHMPGFGRESRTCAERIIPLT